MLKILLPHRIADADYALLREVGIGVRFSFKAFQRVSNDLLRQIDHGGKHHIAVFHPSLRFITAYGLWGIGYLAG